MYQIKKRTCLLNEAKMMIVSDKILSKTQIAQKYGIVNNGLSTVLKTRGKTFVTKNADIKKI